jgi:hypothetical protein
MTIHKLTLTAEMRAALGTMDCWDIEPANLGVLAAMVIGNKIMPQLRRGTMSGVVRGEKYGASASRLSDEFALLGRQCLTILDDSDSSKFCAIAFFHLRFENIHPLIDSNGRVGRLLLAEQVRRLFAAEAQTTLDRIQTDDREYGALFEPIQPVQQFTRMVALLNQIVATQITAIPPLPFSITPKFPDKRAALNSMKAGGQPQHNLVERHTFKQSAVAAELLRSIKGTR